MNLRSWNSKGLFLVMLMIIVGGVTRVTDSGLSITEWEIISGVIPPLNNKQWDEKFNKYKLTSEYRLINSDMSLNEFKNIYWWEYIHRLLGRIIGVFFMVPLLFKSRFFKNYFSFYKDYVFIFLLVVIQGFVGWYMVKSGLIDSVDVSHYRLAIHLILAVLLFVYLSWINLSIRCLKNLSFQKNRENNKLCNLLYYLIPIVFLQIIFGAFMSGTGAGAQYQTFPMMNGQLIPDTLGAAYKNDGFLSLFNNPGSIQFIHRVMGIIIFIYIFFLWLKFYFKKVDSYIKKGINFLLMIVVIQFLLGVFTLVLGMPDYLRILHQLGFLCFLYFFIRLIFYTKKEPC